MREVEYFLNFVDWQANFHPLESIIKADDDVSRQDHTRLTLLVFFVLIYLVK